MLDLELTGGWDHRGIANKGTLYPVVHGILDPLTNPFLSGVGFHIIFVGIIAAEESGIEICGLCII